MITRIGIIAALGVLSLPFAARAEAPPTTEPETAQVVVTFSDSSGQGYSPAALLYRRTDDGHWEATDYRHFPWSGESTWQVSVEPGTYKLDVYRYADQTGSWWPQAPERPLGEPIVITEGETVDLASRSELGATIRGTVHAPDRWGALGQKVTTYRRSSSGGWTRVSYYDYDTEEGFFDAENARANGSYQLQGLSPGTYRVEFLGWEPSLEHRYEREWWSDTHRRGKARTITIRTGAPDVRGINARLERCHGDDDPLCHGWP